jgi:hypothetical protein
MMVFILESRVLYLLRIQELLGEAKEMVQISDSPPTGKAVTVSGSRFGSYRRGSQNPNSQSTRRAAEYKANAHFYISYCDMIDGVPLYGTTRALGTYSTKLPANTVGTIDQLMEDG